MTRAEPPDSRSTHDLVSPIMELVDNLDAMVAYWTADRVCVFAKRAYVDWFGKPREQVIGSTMQDLLGPLYELNLPYIQEALAGRRQIFEREITSPDGTVRHGLATYIPHVVDGRVTGMFVHVANVTPMKLLQDELRAARDEAERLATHDHLTGLPNRVLLEDRIGQAIATAKRKEHLVAVMSVDIDNFKQVNDTCGHDAGDRVLVEVAGRLRRVLRETDTVARFGGDEFLIVTPDITGMDAVVTLAERLLRAARQPVDLQRATLDPHLSVGIALFPQDGATPRALVRRSDEALYAAKRAGKNTYAFANAPDQASGGGALRLPTA